MGLIDQLGSHGPMPALSLALRYAGQRQALIAGNIANLSTPDYQQQDVPPAEFRRVLGEAVERRRAGGGGGGRGGGELAWTPRDGIGRDDRDGALVLRPRAVERGVLAHDRNNRDLERLMQDQAENAAMYRLATELLRLHGEQLKAAIAERA